MRCIYYRSTALEETMTDTLAAQMRAKAREWRKGAPWHATVLAGFADAAEALERQHFDEVHWLSVQKNDLHTAAAEASAREAGLEQRVAELKREAEEHDAEHFTAKAYIAAYEECIETLGLELAAEVSRRQEYRHAAQQHAAHSAALLEQLEACDEARQSNADDVAPLVAALNFVVERWEAVLPAVESSGIMAHIHGWRYQGPGGGFAPAIEQARAALSAAPERSRVVVGLPAKWRTEAGDLIKQGLREGAHMAVSLNECAADLEAAMGMEDGHGE